MPVTAIVPSFVAGHGCVPVQDNMLQLTRTPVGLAAHNVHVPDIFLAATA